MVGLRIMCDIVNIIDFNSVVSALVGGLIGGIGSYWGGIKGAKYAELRAEEIARRREESEVVKYRLKIATMLEFSYTQLNEAQRNLKGFPLKGAYEKNPSENTRLADWKINWQDLFVKADMSPKNILTVFVWIDEVHKINCSMRGNWSSTKINPMLESAIENYRSIGEIINELKHCERPIEQDGVKFHW